MSNRTNPANVATSINKGTRDLGVKDVSNNHLLDVHADNALWDPTSNGYVNPENTNRRP